MNRTDGERTDSQFFRPADPRVAFLVTATVVVASLTTIRGTPAMSATLLFVCLWHAVVTRRPLVTARSLARLLPLAILIVALNAVRGARPIVRLDGRPVGAGAPGPLAGSLQTVLDAAG